MMWSNGFPDTVDLLPGPAAPGALTALVLLPAILPVLLLSGVPTVAAALLVGAAAWLQWRAERAAAVRRVVLDADGHWFVDPGDGVLRSARLTHHWMLPRPWLVGLRLNVDGCWRARTLLLWRGRIGAGTLRHLCVRLRYPREAGIPSGGALQRGHWQSGDGLRRR
ncbi:MAG: hypothetical protein JJT85_12530 [Chromatiales bacterium]|nr:hypothetical protein [Chromatiales bacterium]